MDFDILKKSIGSIVSLNEEEWLQLSGYLEYKTLKKNELLLEQGQLCRSISVVTKGVLIYYKLTDAGLEMTTDFAFEGDWVTDNRSRLNNSPSLLNIKAIEASELLVISNKNLNQCYSKMPKLEKLGRILMERAFVKIVEQSVDLQTLSATERYDKLLLTYPEIFQKVPLYHIANYLGIAPKSLSRIRKG